jgi:3-hydroxybutyryl-CoA dehydrogenase
MINRVGVIGFGLMGGGIVQTCAAAGLTTIVREVSQDLLQKGMGAIEKNLTRLVEKKTITTETKQEITSRISQTTDLKDLADSDLIIEAIIENLEIKRDLFKQLDSICKPGTIFASNTSSLSITEMMTSTSGDRMRRFIGLHFFNPVPIMKLVEVVRTILTDEVVIDHATDFSLRLGKVPVKTSDRTGFIVNRLLVPYMLDAIRALEEGVASIEDIDNGMKLGCGHPMGPLTLIDFVGLDTTYYISEIMFNEFRERRFAAPPLLKRMVMAGLFGRKSGKGFYDYSDPASPIPQKLL